MRGTKTHRCCSLLPAGMGVLGHTRNDERRIVRSAIAELVPCSCSLPLSLNDAGGSLAGTEAPRRGTLSKRAAQRCAKKASVDRPREIKYLLVLLYDVMEFKSGALSLGYDWQRSRAWSNCRCILILV